MFYLIDADILDMNSQTHTKIIIRWTIYNIYVIQTIKIIIVKNAVIRITNLRYSEIMNILVLHDCASRIIYLTQRRGAYYNFRKLAIKFIANTLIPCLLRWSPFWVRYILLILSLLIISMLSSPSCLLTSSIVFTYLSKSVCNIRQDKIILQSGSFF